MQIIQELQRRNVFRVAVGYIVSSWLLVQAADLVLENIGAPDWVMQTIMLILALGFPVALLFSWAYEVTPEGIKRESEIDRSGSITHVTGRKLDRAIVGMLVIALAYLAFDKFMLSGAREAAMVEAMTKTAAEQASTKSQVKAEIGQSIAVLPFVNMSSDAEQDYFSDGLSEELLNLLAKIPSLRVAARTSSFSFKGQNLEIPEIARRLKVTHVLEGSVRKVGDQIRITAQLIKAEDGYHLWSETYDRTLDNVFAIQDEIASAVVAQLKITLLGEAPRVQASDPKAYAFYLQARQLGRQKTPDSLEKSNALYEQVLALDPGYAAAWGGLASNYIQQTSNGLRPRAEGFELARKSANKALAIDPEHAPAHAYLGEAALLDDLDLAAAARHIGRALELEPSNSEILRSGATLYRALGRLDQAVAVCEYMVELDPVNSNSFYALGLMNRYSGNLDAAMAAFQTSLSLSPGRIGLHYGLGEALMLGGALDAALAEIEQEQSTWQEIGLPMVYHALGRPAESDAALASLIEENEQGWAYNIAYVFAFRGEVDRAFEWLGKAIEYDDPGLTDLPIESLFDTLHDDERWLPLLESLGKSLAQLNAIEFEAKLPDPENTQHR